MAQKLQEETPVTGEANGADKGPGCSQVPHFKFKWKDIRQCTTVICKPFSPMEPPFSKEMLRVGSALIGVAQWAGCLPANQMVASLIPGQGTRMGCGTGPQLGVCRRQPTDVSIAHQHFSPSLPLSPKINKIFKK